MSTGLKAICTIWWDQRYIDIVVVQHGEDVCGTLCFEIVEKNQCRIVTRKTESFPFLINIRYLIVDLIMVSFDQWLIK